jgi:hypothetical protein
MDPASTLAPPHAPQRQANPKKMTQSVEPEKNLNQITQ